MRVTLNLKRLVVLLAAAAPAAAHAADATLWVPPGATTLKGVLAFTDVGIGPAWGTSPDFQALAQRLGAGIVEITNDNAFGPYDDRCADGEFKALLDTFAAVGKANGHPELANTPLVGCGHSHGGDYWNYFNACYPERMALIFDKSSGGVEYTGAALETPMVWEIGTNDLLNSMGHFRGEMFSHRTLGTPMTLVLGPAETHTDFTPGPRAMVIALIEAIFKLRVPADADPSKGPVVLNEIREPSGMYWLGDNYTKAIGPWASLEGMGDLSRTSFLPDQAIAAMWMTTGAPLPATIHLDSGPCVTCYKQPAGEPPGAPLTGGGGSPFPDGGPPDVAAPDSAATDASATAPTGAPDAGAAPVPAKKSGGCATAGRAPPACFGPLVVLCLVASLRARRRVR